MDRPKSWTFFLSVLPSLIKIEDRAKLNQDSPLRLARQVYALAFGARMFEPPLSIVKWSIVGSQDAPNFPFKNLGI